jgi:hypothetical protein
MDEDNLNSLNDDNILNNIKQEKHNGLDLNGLGADEEIEDLEDNGDFDEEDSPKD